MKQQHMFNVHVQAQEEAWKVYIKNFVYAKVFIWIQYRKNRLWKKNQAWLLSHISFSKLPFLKREETNLNKTSVYLHILFDKWQDKIVFNFSKDTSFELYNRIWHIIT